jgi:hypothetical protein
MDMSWLTLTLPEQPEGRVSCSSFTIKFYIPTN